MLVRIDPQSGTPLHAQIATALRRAISSRELAVGDQLPVARDLADDLDVNVHTVLRAYQALRDDGIVDLRRGRRATVRRRGRERAAVTKALRAYVEAAQHAGMSLLEARIQLESLWDPDDATSD